MDKIEVEYFYNADVLKYRCEYKEDDIGRITANNDIMNKTLLNRGEESYAARQDKEED